MTVTKAPCTKFKHRLRIETVAIVSNLRLKPVSLWSPCNFLFCRPLVRSDYITRVLSEKELVTGVAVVAQSLFPWASIIGIILTSQLLFRYFFKPFVYFVRATLVQTRKHNINRIYMGPHILQFFTID